MKPEACTESPRSQISNITCDGGAGGGLLIVQFSSDVQYLAVGTYPSAHVCGSPQASEAQQRQAWLLGMSDDVQARAMACSDFEFLLRQDRLTRV